MSDCEHCRCEVEGQPTIDAIDRMLSFSSEPECEATQGQCVPRRVRHLIDACIGYRRALAAERERIIAYVEGLKASRRIAADSHASVDDGLFAAIATAEARLCGSIVYAIREMGKPDDK